MLASGTVLNHRYSLVTQLNDNTARLTWLAEDLSSGELVVVKLLALGGAVQWDDLKLFEREAEVLKRLEHPRIPKYRDYFSIDDRTLWFGLVQEYIPGETLKEKLNSNQRFSQQEVEKVAKDVLYILAFLHQFNPPILHRDIKPSNLIWGEDDHIYLIDFGAVQARPNSAGKTFTVVGTNGYTPMEQFGGQAVPASDLYALGATLIYLFTGISPSELQQEDLQLQYKDKLSQDIQPRLVSWIEKLTEPSLKKRFSTAEEALEAIQDTGIVPVQEKQAQSMFQSLLLEKSSQRLILVIPSLFEIQVIKPLQKLLKQGMGKLEEKFGRFIKQFRNLEKTKQKNILIGGGVAIILALMSVGPILSILILLPLALLTKYWILLIFLWIFFGESTMNYLGRTKIIWENGYLKIFRQFRKNIQWQAEIHHIDKIDLTFAKDAFSQNRQEIVISLDESKINWTSRFKDKQKQYTLGSKLNESELRWLIREMEDWLYQARNR